jgi:hypothetical protein
VPPLWVVPPVLPLVPPLVPPVLPKEHKRLIYLFNLFSNNNRT